MGALTLWRPSVFPRHRDVATSLIDEDEALGWDARELKLVSRPQLYDAVGVSFRSM
jgi:hypothetical protein